MKLHPFSSGTIAFGGVEVPVAFFLIEHPEGNVLVDGGNPLAVARDADAQVIVHTLELTAARAA